MDQFVKDHRVVDWLDQRCIREFAVEPARCRTIGHTPRTDPVHLDLRIERHPEDPAARTPTGIAIGIGWLEISGRGRVGMESKIREIIFRYLHRRYLGSRYAVEEDRVGLA